MDQALSTSIGDQIIYDRRKKSKNIPVLSWMGRRAEDKINLDNRDPMCLEDAKKLFSDVENSTKIEWESVFVLRAIIEDLSREKLFSDDFFIKFDYYSMKYTSIFYKYGICSEDNYSLIFSRLNTIFQARNIDIETFNMLPNLEINRTFVERISDVLKYYTLLEEHKFKVDNLLKNSSPN